MALTINANLNTTSLNNLKATDLTTYNNYVADIQTAISFFESNFANPVTLNINFEWGQATSYGSTVITLAPTAGVQGHNFDVLTANLTYAQVYSALHASDAITAVQKAAVESLDPSNDPTNGANFVMTNGEAKALGLTPGASADGSDAHVGMGVAGGKLADGSQLNSDLVLGLEHEISEVMGRLAFAGNNNEYTPLDLFRYQAADGLATDAIGAAAGARDLAPADHFSYFSYDGRTVTLLFDSPTQVATNKQDVADWDPTVTNDPFTSNFSGSHIAVSTTDMQVMNVLGWQLGTGLIDTLTLNQQTELIYIGYFNRAADGGGFNFWEAQDALAQAPVATGGFGQSASIALTNIANSFTPQAETIAIYPFLSNPNPNYSDSTVQAAITTFVQNVYGNLFGHAADSGGLAYWTGQIESGAVGLGAAVLAIANGAQGSDATILQNKITVALDFTSLTGVANVPTTAALVAEAKTVLAGVDGLSLNDASVTAAEALIAPWIASHPNGALVALVGSASSASHALLV